MVFIVFRQNYICFKSNAKNGTALIIAAILSLILGAIAVSLIAFTSSRHLDNQKYLAFVNSEYTVKAGLSATVIALNQDATILEVQGNAGHWDSVIAKLPDGTWGQLSNDLGELTSTQAQRVFAQQKKSLKQRPLLDFRVDLTMDGNIYLAQVHSFSTGQGYSILGTIIQTSTIPGVFGNRFVQVDGRAKIDSYDSSKGKYSSSNRANNSHVGSNGPILIKANANILGNVSPGKEYPIDVPEKVHGRIIPSFRSIELKMPDITWQNEPAEVFAQTNKTILSGGNYHYLDIELRGELVILGQVTIFCHGNFLVTGEGKITLTSGAKLSLNVSGKVIFQNFSSAADHDPHHFKITSISNDKVEIIDDATVAAMIYAPQSCIIMANNTRFYGTIAAYELYILDNALFHYDEAAKDPETATMFTLAMTEQISFDNNMSFKENMTDDS